MLDDQRDVMKAEPGVADTAIAQIGDASGALSGAVTAGDKQFAAAYVSVRIGSRVYVYIGLVNTVSALQAVITVAHASLDRAGN